MKTLEYNSKRLAKNTGVDERIAKRHRFIEHLKKSDANIQPQHMQSLSEKFPVVPPRIASFIGTSNRTDLLRDPTGSRRFICIEVEHDIDCTEIEHSQIYAQLKEELLAGARHRFSKEEEHALLRHNSAYYRVNPIEDIVRSTYVPAAMDKPDCLSLSAAIIHQELRKSFPAILRSCTPIQLAQILTAAGIIWQHTRLGNVYLVKRMKDGEEWK